MTSLPLLPHGPTNPPAPTTHRQRPSDGPIADSIGRLWNEAQKRMWQPKYWWRYVWLKRNFNLRLLKPHEFKLMVPSGSLTNCHQCENICCTGPTSRVSLNLLDIARLMDAQLDAFIEPPPHQSPPSENKKMAQHDAEDSIFFKSFPILKRDETQTCALLTKDLQCGAFPHWPLSCERYPFAVNLIDKTVFWAQGCGHQELHYEADAHLRTRQLFHAALEAYNQKVKDAMMLYFTMPELAELGILKHLKLDGFLGKQAEKFVALNAESALNDDEGLPQK